MPAFAGRSGAIAVTVCAVLAVGASVAHAAHAVVKDCSNDTDLRAKLAQLQAAGGGKLKFRCGTTPTIILSGGPLTITTKVKMIGGEGTVTLSGNNTTTLLDVTSTGKATLRRMTLTRGFNASGDGGAIRNFGSLTLDFCVLSANTSVASGGAILSYGTLNVILTRFEDNRAANGAAIYPRFAASSTTISRSFFTDNETTSTTDGWGGAILMWDGATVTVDSTSFEGNTARSGGAIYVFGATSTLNSTRNTWKSNRASDGSGGHVYNQGNFNSLGEDLFEYGHAVDGGAIFNESNADLLLLTAALEHNGAQINGGALYNVSRATLMHTTLSENRCGPGSVSTSLAETVEDPGRGGAVYNRGSLLLENSTVSGNLATIGGGLANASANAFAQLLHATITANTATTGGGLSSIAGTVQATNTIVGDNTSGGDCTAPGGATGTVVSLGFNLSSDATCSFTKLSDLPNTPADLNPLAENGGFAKTHMPASDSKAVDGAGGDDCLDEDERFTTRPQGAACDIGAVERCGAGKPAAFALLAPANGGTLEVFGTLDWSDASCATQYLLTVRVGSSTGPAYATDVPVSASSMLAPIGVREPTTFAWRVKACNKKKCRTSPWWTFVAAPFLF